jgi:hypothetical protein
MRLRSQIKNSCFVFDQGIQTPRNGWKHSAVRFSVFGSPDQTLALVFDLLHETRLIDQSELAYYWNYFLIGRYTVYIKVWTHDAPLRVAMLPAMAKLLGYQPNFVAGSVPRTDNTSLRIHLWNCRAQRCMQWPDCFVWNNPQQHWRHSS